MTSIPNSSSFEHDTVAPQGARSSGDSLLLFQRDAARAGLLADALASDAREIVSVPTPDALHTAAWGLNPDLVLLDLSLENFATLCLRLNAQAPELPIVAIDWDEGGEAHAVEALNAGADGYVVASRVHELRAHVDANVRHKRRYDGSVRQSGIIERDLFDNEPETVTDAPNRSGLDQALVRMVREDVPLGLLFVDVDHFSAINEAQGRIAGDRTLSALSRVLREHARKGDFVTRYGGEEFVVLLRGADLAEASELAEGIRAAVEKLVAPGLLHHFTVSIGVAVRESGSGERADEFLCRADLALYDAKALGRNRIMGAESGPGLAKTRSEPTESGAPRARTVVTAA